MRDERKDLKALADEMFRAALAGGSPDKVSRLIGKIIAKADEQAA